MSLSAEEFLQSGRVSTGVLLLHDEFDENDEDACDSGNDGGDYGDCSSADDHDHDLDGGAENGGRTQRRIVENAARLSLLLARSYADCYEDSVVPSITLADFFVNFHEGRRKRRHRQRRQGQQPSPSTSSAAAHRPKRTVLLGVDNFSPKKQNRDAPRDEKEEKKHRTVAMIALGALLYSVFSQSLSSLENGMASPPPLDVSRHDEGRQSSLGSASSASGGRSCDSSTSRKSQRSEEPTVFRRLVDSRLIPISVCRLLSDMIDIGPGGRARTPFVSFAQVCRDLEGMVYRPSVHLHDSYFPHHHRHLREVPVFGRMLCGRREQVTTLMEIANRMEQSVITESSSSGDGGIEAVIVSGIVGSGKSHVVQAVGETLTRLGWIVAKAKFERGKAHASGGIVLSMFDGILSHLVSLREGGEEDDVAYCSRVSAAIAETFDRDSLSRLAGFLPSLRLLVDGGCPSSPAAGGGAGGGAGGEDAEEKMTSGYGLEYPMSKLLGIILESDRFLMMCCDDLQWADKSSIDLLVEIVLNLGASRGHCMFVGMHRSDSGRETGGDNDPLSLLRTTRYVSTTEIKLSSLSQEDVLDLVTTELGLPRRMVAHLADMISKKTSGHALFVIELMNKLLNESIITYSSQLYRFSWEPYRIDILEMGDNVAELIASNVSSLPAESQRVLRILSCFGIQVDDTLLQILENFQEGIIASIDAFVQQGIFDRAGPIVMFSHDLILQALSESWPPADRRALHLQVGNHLGAIGTMNSPSSPQTEQPLVDGMNRLQLIQHSFFAGNHQVTSSLISLACDQINLAGVDYVTKETERVKFAEWNLTSGHMMGHESNFSAALHYYEEGISFIRENNGCMELRSMLYRGAMMMAFALAKSEEVLRFANTLISNLPFQETIEIEVIVLKSLGLLRRVEEATARALWLLRRLNFDIPPSPSREISLEARRSTDAMVSQYGLDGIIESCDKSSDKSPEHSIVKVLDSFFNCLFVMMDSPLSSFLMCAILRYSLQHGAWIESAPAFVVYGMTKIAREGDFQCAKMLAAASRAIIEKNRSTKDVSAIEIRVLAIAGTFIDIWFKPLKSIGRELSMISENGLKRGVGGGDIICMKMEAWSARLHGGENLSIMVYSSLDHLRFIARHSSHLAEFAICDCILLMDLTGKFQDHFSVFDDVRSLDDIHAKAEKSKNHMLMYRTLVTKLLRSYWRGDLITAEEHSRNARLNPFSKYGTYCLIHTFYGGLVSFHLYRKLGGDDRLKEAREMLEMVCKWAETSMDVFGSRWALLKAEEAASCDETTNGAEQLYKIAIEAARTHGNMHELGLAYSLLGDYYALRGATLDSMDCFAAAKAYYSQWGATAVAEAMLRNRDLDMSSHMSSQMSSLSAENASDSGSKRRRD